MREIQVSTMSHLRASRPPTVGPVTISDTHSIGAQPTMVNLMTQNLVNFCLFVSVCLSGTCNSLASASSMGITGPQLCLLYIYLKLPIIKG